MIDNNGRIKGRISIVDIVLVIAVIGLIAGFIITRSIEDIADIIRPNTPFEVVIQVEGIRDVIVDAVSEGDLMFRQHERNAIGRVTNIEVEQALGYMHHLNGTVSRVPIEQRYTIFITLEAVGSERARGFFINGNDHMAPGGHIPLLSNRVFLPTGRIESVRRVD